MICAVYGLALILMVLGIGPLAAATGDYTQQQASAGRQVFDRHCAKCHGSRLQGQAGPPLAGSKFASNLEYSKISAQQIFNFIKTQMPANAPASLSKKQYLQALAYILSKNGYPKGAIPLSEQRLAQVELLPYPGKTGKAQSHTDTSSHSQ